MDDDKEQVLNEEDHLEGCNLCSQECVVRQAALSNPAGWFYSSFSGKALCVEQISHLAL